MTQKTRKTIVEPNLGLYIEQIVALAVDGWELDSENPPIQFGVMYEANFLKNTADVQPDPATRSDILTAARAAKKKKAEAVVEESPKAEEASSATDEMPTPGQEPSGVLSDDVQAAATDSTTA